MPFIKGIITPCKNVQNLRKRQKADSRSWRVWLVAPFMENPSAVFQGVTLKRKLTNTYTTLRINLQYLRFPALLVLTMYFSQHPQYSLTKSPWELRSTLQHSLVGDDVSFCLFVSCLNGSRPLPLCAIFSGRKTKATWYVYVRYERV